MVGAKVKGDNISHVLKQFLKDAAALEPEPLGFLLGLLPVFT